MPLVYAKQQSTACLCVREQDAKRLGRVFPIDVLARLLQVVASAARETIVRDKIDNFIRGGRHIRRVDRCGDFAGVTRWSEMTDYAASSYHQDRAGNVFLVM